MQASFTMKRMKHFVLCRKGLSLVEVMVTCVIFSFLVAAISMSIFVGNSSWQVNSVEVELQQDLRQAMERIRNDLQQTGAVSLDASVPINDNWVTYTAFNFRKVDGAVNRLISWDTNWTQFTLNGTNLERTYGPDPSTDPATVVAENIQSMQIRRQASSSKIVEVALTAQKNTLTGAQGRAISSTLNFQIQLRN